MSRTLPESAFELTAGCLCLDFANTLDNRVSGQPKEKLNRFDDLVQFGGESGVFTLAECRKLRKEGEEKQEEAKRCFEGAVELREVIYRVLSAAAEGEKVEEADATAFNQAVRRVNGETRLAPVSGKHAWGWVEENSGVERLLGRIVRSAVELLTSEEIRRVKRCGAEKCAWLFLDRSRSGNRRWCEMRTCGSRQKAKAYYQRKTLARKRGTAENQAEERGKGEVLTGAGAGNILRGDGDTDPGNGITGKNKEGGAKPPLRRKRDERKWE